MFKRLNDKLCNIFPMLKTKEPLTLEQIENHLNEHNVKCINLKDISNLVTKNNLIQLFINNQTEQILNIYKQLFPKVVVMINKPECLETKLKQVAIIQTKNDDARVLYYGDWNATEIKEPDELNYIYSFNLRKTEEEIRLTIGIASSNPLVTLVFDNQGKFLKVEYYI